MCEDLGLPRLQAQGRALLLYTSYLGLFDYVRVGIGEGLSDAELRDVARDLMATLVPGGPA